MDLVKASKYIPEIPMEMAEALYNIGFILLVDDIHDVGYTVYHNRRAHIYKGKKAPNHTSPLHHWQVAIPLLFISKIAGLVALAQETISNMGFNDEPENTKIIKYNDYIEEMNTPPIIPHRPNLIEKMPRSSFSL